MIDDDDIIDTGEMGIINLSEDEYIRCNHAKRDRFEIKRLMSDNKERAFVARINKNVARSQEIEENAAGSMGLLPSDLPRAGRYAILTESGIPQAEARDIVGYSKRTPPSQIESTSTYRQYKAEIRTQRAQIAAEKGLSLRDSVLWYLAKSENKEAKELRNAAMVYLDDGNIESAQELLKEAEKIQVSDSMQIKARERLDKLLGYDAPIEVDREDIREQGVAVTLVQVLNQLQLTPLQARELLTKTQQVKGLNSGGEG
jgi:hypothetical protein